MARKKRESLRADTTLAPIGEPEGEMYIRGLPDCCLAAFKEAVMKGGNRRLLDLWCPCGRGWHVTSSLDDRVLERFVTHGGSRADGSYPAA